MAIREFRGREARRDQIAEAEGGLVSTWSSDSQHQHSACSPSLPQSQALNPIYYSRSSAGKERQGTTDHWAYIPAKKTPGQQSYRIKVEAQLLTEIPAFELLSERHLCGLKLPNNRANRKYV